MDLGRAIKAIQMAREKPWFPNPAEALPDAGLMKAVRGVARDLTGDIREATSVMGESAKSLAVTHRGVSPVPISIAKVDNSLVSAGGDNVTRVVQCLIDPDFLVNVARYQSLFPGLPIDQQAKMLGPLARGQVLVGADDGLFARAKAIYHAEGLAIPDAVQKLASVPPVRMMFEYASVFATLAIHAADAYKQHNVALSAVANNNEELARMAREIFEGFAEKEQMRIESMNQITQLLEMEDQLMQQAMASPDGADRTAAMEARNDVVQQLASMMNMHTQSDLETMEKEAGILQVMGVQLDSEGVRAALLGQVRMDYKLYLTAYRALNMDLNLVQMLLMAATLEVRNLQAAFIGAKLTEVADVYQVAKGNMKTTLNTFKDQFMTVGAPASSADEIYDPDFVEGHFQEEVAAV